MIDKQVVVRWQRSTKTWTIKGDIGFRRHPRKKEAVKEARDYCYGLMLQGYIAKLTIHHKRGGSFKRSYPPGLA